MVLENDMHPRALLPLLLSMVACGAATPSAAPASITVPVPAASIAPGAVGSVASNEDGAAIPISPRNPVWGSRTALVTIVEFSDFQCPFCGRVEPTLAALRQAYGPETLRIVWKNDPLPFHENARSAAEAAMGALALAGPWAFWRFHDWCFANQTALGTDAYVQWATEAGVTDVTAFRAGLESHRWADAVDADLRDVKAAGVTGTPHFFINGTTLLGAQPLEKFKEVIDAELVKAQAKVASGLPRDRVYAAMAHDNLAQAPRPDEGDDDEPEDTRTVFRIPVLGAPVRGNPTALVTIVEFSDFQCPFCSRVEPTLKAVRDRYGDKVRLVWRNEPLPFHPNAEPAAEAALEVRMQLGDAAFWTMHDKLFAEQRDLSAPVLARLAGEMGANVERVRRAVSARTYMRLIEADLDVSEDFRAEGTPHFFINGRRLVGAQPEEKFDQIIDEEIVKAQALLAQGVKPADLYDTLVRTGQGPAPLETKDLPVSLPPGDPARGSAAARVTVHEWADFQCPFCGRVESTIDQLMKDYSGRVRLVWHDLPLPMHDLAAGAAEAAREALTQRGPAGFWALHDLLFKDQTLIARSDLDGDARALKLDMNRWTAALDASGHTSEIEADRQAATAMGIAGTPAFVVVPNGARAGYFISGAQPVAKFRKAIERALSEAK